MKHGFILIDKPAGVTSHDVVAEARRSLHERGIGHLGTLDPAATGLLVLAVGRKALKAVELFSSLPKTYEADVRFGAVTDTYDAEGVMEEIAPPAGWEVPDESVVQRVIADRFLGRVQQVPPQYSAVHVGGERAYRKARQGRGVDLPPRDVEITECRILSYDYPRLRLFVACGSGTYIRSLAHDLGALLHCGAYLEGLRRTAVGHWSLVNAIPPAEVSWGRVLPLKDILASLPRRDLTQDESEDLRCGRDIEGTVEPKTIGWAGERPIALLEQKGEGNIHARKVFETEPRVAEGSGECTND